MYKCSKIFHFICPWINVVAYSILHTLLSGPPIMLYSPIRLCVWYVSRHATHAICMLQTQSGSLGDCTSKCLIKKRCLSFLVTCAPFPSRPLTSRTPWKTCAKERLHQGLLSCSSIMCSPRDHFVFEDPFIENTPKRSLLCSLCSHVCDHSW